MLEIESVCVVIRDRWRACVLLSELEIERMYKDICCYTRLIERVGVVIKASDCDDKDSKTIWYSDNQNQRIES